MGARFQRILTAMVLSYALEEYGIEYLHLPMAYEGFGLNFKQGDSIRQQGYPTSHSTEYIKNAQKWDDELNYKGTTIHEINPDEFNVIMGPQREVYQILMNDIRLNQVNCKIYLFDSLHELVRGNVINSELFNLYRDRLNTHFDLKSDPTNEVIVHIRRKDVIDHRDRYLPDSYYLDLIKSHNPNEILITTQRDGFDSDLYSNYKIIYDDEISEIGIIKKMVNAKTLIISVSSFSYVAAVLSNGIIHVPKTFHRQEILKHWL
jgi:hypothetical protein